MTIETVENKLRESARAELHREIDTAMQPIRAMLENAGLYTMWKMEGTPFPNHTADDLLNGLREWIFKKVSDGREQEAITRFLRKVEELHDVIEDAA